MSKAILVIDMPKSCDECPLFENHSYRDMCCLGMNARTIDYPYPKDFRQDWCPLKPAPKIQKMWCDDEMDAWIRGYNNCVREILGKD
jgi:hypothetical protein